MKGGSGTMLDTASWHTCVLASQDGTQDQILLGIPREAGGTTWSHWGLGWELSGMTCTEVRV